jgi:hypothetical protein
MIHYEAMNPYSLEHSRTSVLNECLSTKQASLLEPTSITPKLRQNDFPTNSSKVVRRKTESSASPYSSSNSILPSSSMGMGRVGSHDGMQRRPSTSNTFRHNSSFPTHRNGLRGTGGSSCKLTQSPGSNASMTSVHGPISVSAKNWSGSAVMQVAQRSNASTVKAVIADLQKVCDEATMLASSTSSPSEIEPPFQICFMLAQWSSVDVYYKVVIAKYNGIQATLRAMTAFPSCPDLQTSCCTVLANLSNGKDVVVTEGGVQAILKSMQDHPASTFVQSAALEALRPLIPLLKQETAILEEVRELLKRGKDMYLTKAGTKAAMDIQSYLENIPSL